MAPVGMGMVDKAHFAENLLSRDVFFDQPRYNVEEEIEEMKQLSVDFLTTHLDVTPFQKTTCLFWKYFEGSCQRRTDEKAVSNCWGAWRNNIRPFQIDSSNSTFRFK